ncbi:hypothetical protein BH09PSE2_BH09PSE2_24940 [soil metagenome]
MKTKSTLTNAFWITLGAMLFIGALALWGVFVALKGGGAPISLHGWIAMGLAIGLSAVVGGGLMWLAFFSARRGYDDQVMNEDPDLDL